MMSDANPTSEDSLIALHAQWTRLGTFLRVPATDEPVDLERLLIASAQAAPDDARLPLIVGSWLAVYGATVDADRLQALIAEHDAVPPAGWPITSAILGALLTWGADLKASAQALRIAATACRPLVSPQWLSRIMRIMEAYGVDRRAEARPRFLAWGLWHTEEAVKVSSIIRPRSWIEARSPELSARFARLPAAQVAHEKEVERHD